MAKGSPENFTGFSRRPGPWNDTQGVGWQLWQRVHSTGLVSRQMQKGGGRFRSGMFDDPAPLATDIYRRWGLNQDSSGGAYESPLLFAQPFFFPTLARKMSPSLRSTPMASDKLQFAFAEPAAFPATNDLTSPEIPGSAYSKVSYFGEFSGGPAAAKGTIPTFVRKKPALGRIANSPATAKLMMSNTSDGSRSFGSLPGDMPQTPSPASVLRKTSDIREPELLFRKLSGPPSDASGATADSEQHVVSTNNPLGTLEQGSFNRGASSPSLQRSEQKFRSSDLHQGVPEGNRELPLVTNLPEKEPRGFPQTISGDDSFSVDPADSSASLAKKVQKASLPAQESTFSQQRGLPLVTGYRITKGRMLSRAMVGGSLVHPIAFQSNPPQSEPTPALVSPPNTSAQSSGLLLRKGHRIIKNRTLSRAMVEKAALQNGMPITNPVPPVQRFSLSSPQSLSAYVDGLLESRTMQSRVLSRATVERTALNSGMSISNPGLRIQKALQASFLNDSAYEGALPLSVSRRITKEGGMLGTTSDEKPDVLAMTSDIFQGEQQIPSVALQKSFDRGGEMAPITSGRQEPQSRFSPTVFSAGALFEKQSPVGIRRDMVLQRSGFPMGQRRFSIPDSINGRSGTGRVDASMPGPSGRFIQQVPRSITLTQDSALPAKSRLSLMAITTHSAVPLLLHDRVQRLGDDIKKGGGTTSRMNPIPDSETISIPMSFQRELVQPRFVSSTAGFFSTRSEGSANGDTAPTKVVGGTGSYRAGEIAERIQRSAKTGLYSRQETDGTFPSGSVSEPWWLPMAALPGQSGSSLPRGRSEQPTTLQRFYAHRGKDYKVSESPGFPKTGTLGGLTHSGHVPLPLQRIPSAKGLSHRFLAGKYLSPMVEKIALVSSAETRNQAHQAPDPLGYRPADSWTQKAAERSTFSGNTELFSPVARIGKIGGSELNRRMRVMQTRLLGPDIQGERPSVSDGMMGPLASSLLPMQNYPVQRNIHNDGEGPALFPLQTAASIEKGGNRSEAINRFPANSSTLPADNSMTLLRTVSHFVSLKPWVGSLGQGASGKATIADFSPETSLTQFMQKRESFSELPLVQRARSEAPQRGSSVSGAFGSVVQATNIQPLGTQSVNGSGATSSSSGENEETLPDSSANITPPSIDVDELVEKAWKKIMLKLTIEKERRGTMRWP